MVGDEAILTQCIAHQYRVDSQTRLSGRVCCSSALVDNPNARVGISLAYVLPWILAIGVLMVIVEFLEKAVHVQTCSGLGTLPAFDRAGIQHASVFCMVRLLLEERCCDTPHVFTPTLPSRKAPQICGLRLFFVSNSAIEGSQSGPGGRWPRGHGQDRRVKLLLVFPQQSRRYQAKSGGFTQTRHCEGARHPTAFSYYGSLGRSCGDLRDLSNKVQARFVLRYCYNAHVT